MTSRIGHSAPDQSVPDRRTRPVPAGYCSGPGYFPLAYPRTTSDVRLCGAALAVLPVSQHHMPSTDRSACRIAATTSAGSVTPPRVCNSQTSCSARVEAPNAVSSPAAAPGAWSRSRPSVSSASNGATAVVDASASQTDSSTVTMEDRRQRATSEDSNPTVGLPYAPDLLPNRRRSILKEGRSLARAAPRITRSVAQPGLARGRTLP